MLWPGVNSMMCLVVITLAWHDSNLCECLSTLIAKKVLAGMFMNVMISQSFVCNQNVNYIGQYC